MFSYHRNILIAIACFLLLPAFLHAQSQAKEAHLEARTIQVQNEQREYYIHFPSGRSGQGRPVVFVLHGGKGTAVQRARQTGFNIIADRDDFVAVYPQGLNKQWNSSHQSNDVAFFTAMINTLVNQESIDSKRIYIIGGSNGGMMTYILACDLADRIAAVVPIVASMPTTSLTSCQPRASVPILIMAGTADPLMPYKGGLVAHGKGDLASKTVISIEETLSFWRNHNRCPTQSSTRQLPDRDRDDGITTEAILWRDCLAGSQVILYRMDGAGHGLPGRSANKSFIAKRVGGKSTNDFDSTEEAWAFVRQFTRQPSVNQ